VLTSPAQSLRALLALRGPEGQSPAWVQLIVRDLQSLYRFHKEKLKDLGDPTVHFERWGQFITCYPVQWKQLVQRYSISESVLDRASSKRKPDDLPCEFQCVICSDDAPARFYTQKALDSHMRAHHHQRNVLKNYIGHDFACPVCKTIFSTRLRAIAHVTEKRRRGKRITCHDQLLSGRWTPCTVSVIDELDRADTVLRRQAQREGLTQPRSQGVAKRRKVLPPENVEHVQGPQLKRHDAKLSGLCAGGALDCQAKRRRLVTKTTACQRCFKPLQASYS
jgi:hypothetical protein